jgi:hypothetical protein
MKEQHGTKRPFIPVLGNVVLVSLGLAIALGLVETLMSTFPTWAPRKVRFNPPARRVKTFIDETHDLGQSDGDLYHLAAETINEYIQEILPDTASKTPGNLR